MKRPFCRAVLAALLLSAAGQAAHAGEKITLMVGGIEKIIYLPAKLAERLGYFREQGLDVDLLSEPAGVHAENQLVSGALEGVIGFYDHSIDLQAKGKYIESVVQLSHAPGEVVLVASRLADKIRSPADFGGRTLGVTGLGSSTNFLVQYLAVADGVPVHKVTSLPVGSGNTFIAAMQQHRIDAGITTEPTVSRLLKTGQAKVLVDMRNDADTRRALGGPYPCASLYMRNDWVAQHPAVVQKLANALVKTLRYIHDHDAAEIASHMPADFYAGDKAMYIQALAQGKGMFTVNGRMPEQGPETVLKVLSAFNRNVKGKHIDLSKTYTTAFVDAVH